MLLVIHVMFGFKAYSVMKVFPFSIAFVKKIFLSADFVFYYISSTTAGDLVM